MELTISETIEIIGIITTFFTSIVAIVISVISIRQNSKMIEESKRPYITMYGDPGYRCSLVIKNFGQSSATIDSFDSNYDLDKCFNEQFNIRPFANIEGTALAPGQLIQSEIDILHVLECAQTITFTINYSAHCKKYIEVVTINLLGAMSLYNSHPPNENI